ncbi:MAG: hypothetical protein CEE40_10735 [Chloroflexi bacterium B3_Chlor]|nr:MAG: hypothetical protein CEE40_10735 [Chloroflexi bacterium B3_Chlor]
MLDSLASDYAVHVLRPQRWVLTELQHLSGAVEDLATLMGGSDRFRREIRRLFVSKLSLDTSMAAMAFPVLGVVYFKRASWGNPPELKWQTVHELGHIWDMRKRLRLSRGLKRTTGSTYGRFVFQLPIPFKYEPGGRWLESRDAPLNALEDWADSVATYVYPGHAESLPPSRSGGPRLISPVRWNYVCEQMQVQLPYPTQWIPYF